MVSEFPVKEIYGSFPERHKYVINLSSLSKQVFYTCVQACAQINCALGNVGTPKNL